MLHSILSHKFTHTNTYKLVPYLDFWLLEIHIHATVPLFDMTLLSIYLSTNKSCHICLHMFMGFLYNIMFW